MVGREHGRPLPARATPKIGETIFEVEDWSVYHPLHADRQVIKGVDLNVRARRDRRHRRADGRGPHRARHEHLRPQPTASNISGEVLLHGKRDRRQHRRARRSPTASPMSPRTARAYGLVLDDDIKHNITLANLAGVVEARRHRRHRASSQVANDYREQAATSAAPACSRRRVNLSGGNQQKVVLSKWLFADPEVLILDEPTRGIDVGAKYEIYTHHQRAGASRARASSMISSEMPELLGMCDRIYVMNEGRWSASCRQAEASQEKIMRAIVQVRETLRWTRDR